MFPESHTYAVAAARDEKENPLRNLKIDVEKDLTFQSQWRSQKRFFWGGKVVGSDGAPAGVGVRGKSRSNP